LIQKLINPAFRNVDGAGTVDIEYQLVGKGRVKLNFKRLWWVVVSLVRLDFRSTTLSALYVHKRCISTLTDGDGQKCLRLQASTPKPIVFLNLGLAEKPVSFSSSLSVNNFK
jgi:hypothetical protein